MSIKNKLQYIIKKSLPVDMDVNKIVIEIPKDKKNGDYSTNVAFLLTKELKSSPINIANDIIKNISDDMIDRIEVANPGFINFYINKDYLLNNINVINDMGKNYGKSDFGKLEKINIEYANARISSILRGKEIPKDIKFSTIESDSAYTILNKLLEFEDVIISAASKGLPHLVANYLFELAGLFHSYYSVEKIVTDDEIYTKERIALIKFIAMICNIRKKISIITITLN
jgi:arginyl-tRNA synthetase